MSTLVEKSKRDLSVLLEFADRKMNQHRLELFTHTSEGHLRRVAAGALVRLPGCVRAILSLADARLPAEVNTINRTVLELSIIACWVGNDESRAQNVWNKSVTDRQRGFDRIERHVELAAEVREMMDSLRSTHAGSNRPDLSQCARDAIDTDAFPARKVAVHLYETMYDWLSAAAHGEIRLAPLLAKGLEEPLLETAADDAVSLMIYLLMATSVQLGFVDEYAHFLDEHDLVSS